MIRKIIVFLFQQTMAALQTSTVTDLILVCCSEKLLQMSHIWTQNLGSIECGQIWLQWQLTSDSQCINFIAASKGIELEPKGLDLACRPNWRQRFPATS